jgi:hypothetical protein
MVQDLLINGRPAMLVRPAVAIGSDLYQRLDLLEYFRADSLDLLHFINALKRVFCPVGDDPLGNGRADTGQGLQLLLCRRIEVHLVSAEACSDADTAYRKNENKGCDTGFDGQHMNPPCAVKVREQKSVSQIVIHMPQGEHFIHEKIILRCLTFLFCKFLAL